MIAKRVLLRHMIASRTPVPTLWFENADGDRWVPDMENWDEAPPGYVYQWSRFPKVLREVCYKTIQQDEVDACPHPPEAVQADLGIIETMEGRKCRQCGGYQSKQKGAPWPEKWEAHGSQEVMSGESSWPEDLVLAMVRPSAEELALAAQRVGSEPRLLDMNDAILMAATSCERCLNALCWRYGLGDGYPPFSPEWDEASTECAICKTPGVWDWILGRSDEGFFGNKLAKLSPHQRGWEHRREKDERAQVNIPPEFHGLWNKLKSRFKGTPDQRAEQFMEYVEEHPDENIEWLQENADREVAKMTREFEREQREQAKQERECDKRQEKYENAWYKEQERQTQEKRKLKRLQERAESVCQDCPTCPEYEPVPFAASMGARVASRYKSKKKLDSGNTVYEYSERQVANRNRKKAEQIAKLERKIGELRKKVQRDIKSDDPDTFLTALAVALMDHTYERVGNDDSASEGHFGVTGWQRKHVSFGRGNAKVRYVGKSGVKHEKVVSDKSLVAALRNAYEAMDGDDTGIFEYEGGKVDARKVNAYLKPFDVTAKDIRGLHANREMRERLSKIRKGKLPDDPKERQAQLKDEFKQALEATAEAVGHEAATLRSQYLVPGLEESYLKDGTVAKSKKAAYPFSPWVYDDGCDCYVNPETGERMPNGPSESARMARLVVQRCMKTAMNLRDIEVTADKAEDILQGLIEGIDDLEDVERKLGLDIRNMTSLMRQFDHNADEYHNGEDVLTHTKWVLEDVQELTEDMDDERKLVIRLAALMHDLGKAYTFEIQPDGSHTFRKHAEKSVVLVEALLRKHRKDLGDLYQRVVDLVEKHDAFMVLLNARKDAKGLKYLNKFMQGAIYLGGHIEDLMTLAKADGNRSKVRQQTLDDIEAVLADIKEVERQREEEAKAKEALAREFERKLPEIRELLEAEGLPEAAEVGTLSEINAILGKSKRYDLIKRIRSMLGG